MKTSVDLSVLKAFARRLMSFLVAASFIAFAQACFAFPVMTIEVDERTMPGWIFIEFRSDCPASNVSGKSVGYSVDDRGYGCSSTATPSGWHRLRVILVDRASGEKRALSGAVTRKLFSAEGWLHCGATATSRNYFHMFLGTEEEQRRAPTKSEAMRKVGLDCPDIKS